jgi:protein-L-isoaspartate(D-aspartate) O-methyltransferase
MNKTNADLVEYLSAYGYLRSKNVIEAMQSVDRAFFVSDDMREYAYEDIPLRIAGSQTISAPHMVAMMCEAAELKEGQKVLEIGAGSGYSACVISKITKAKVISVERVKELVEFARKNLERANCKSVVVISGDGTLGYPEEAPYDRIIVTAGAPSPPQPLIDQLKEGGKLIIPLGSRYSQDLMRITKKGNSTQEENLGGCVFVPLIGKYAWEE